MELFLHSGSRGGKPERLALADTSRVGELLDAVCKQELGSDGAGRRVRVIHQGKILDESQATMTLKEAGIVNGDSLLVFTLTSIPMPGAPQTWPAPNSSAIKSAILAEAKKQGIEPQVRARRSHTISQPYFPSELASLEQPLLQLLQAFNPRGAASRGGPGAAPGGLAADPVAAAMQLANAFDVPVSDVHGGGRPRRGGSDEDEEDEDEDEEQEGPAEIRPPEPSAQAMEQLTGMGFLEPVVRKALVLGRNNVDAALDWLLAHSEDADAAEPPTQQQLRQVYGAPSSQTIAESEAVDQLCEMGFERPAVTSAIRRFRNMELALAYLLQTASSSPSASAPANPPPAPPSGPPSAPPTDHRSEHPSSTPSTAGPPGRAGQVASALEAAAPNRTTPLTHTPPRVTHSIPHPTPEEEEQQRQQQQQQQQHQGDGNQGDVDMDAHREDAQHGSSSGQQDGQGLHDLMNQLQAHLPPHWRHLAQHMEQSLMGAAREQGLPSDSARVDPSAILAGMARGGQGAQLFAGMPLPPDFTDALQRAEREYGGQANLMAAAQQMAQMLEQMTGARGGAGGGGSNAQQ